MAEKSDIQKQVLGMCEAAANRFRETLLELRQEKINADSTGELRKRNGEVHEILTGYLKMARFAKKGDWQRVKAHASHTKFKVANFFCRHIAKDSAASKLFNPVQADRMILKQEEYAPIVEKIKAISPQWKLLLESFKSLEEVAALVRPLAAAASVTQL